MASEKCADTVQSIGLFVVFDVKNLQQWENCRRVLNVNMIRRRTAGQTRRGPRDKNIQNE